MRNEILFVRELPTLDFIMNEINEQQAQAMPTANRKIGGLFLWLAAAQILQIAAGAVLGLFVAPASLFVSRTETEAFIWIAAGFFGIALIALGVILIPLSVIAAVAFRNDKKWRNVVGIIAAGLACLAFPFGTILGGYLVWKITNRKKDGAVVKII